LKGARCPSVRKPAPGQLSGHGRAKTVGLRPDRRERRSGAPLGGSRRGAGLGDLASGERDRRGAALRVHDQFLAVVVGRGGQRCAVQDVLPLVRLGYVEARPRMALGRVVQVQGPCRVADDGLVGGDPDGGLLPSDSGLIKLLPSLNRGLFQLLVSAGGVEQGRLGGERERGGARGAVAG
jgi:hypothetical protein